MSDHPFLARLDAAQRSRLLADARRETFSPGAFLFHLNGPADALYLVERGRVSLEVDEPGRGAATLEEVHAGDLLGLSWLFSPYRWHLDARAVEPVEVTVLPAVPLRAAIDADAALGRAVAFALLGTVYERLVRARFQRLDVYRGRG
jgi:CRP/FNR family transcriptional regulator, cyclic AMP receptor protein